MATAVDAPIRLAIVGWTQYLHYRTRKTTPWVRLYRDLARDPRWRQLSAPAAKLLIDLVLLASERSPQQGRLTVTRSELEELAGPEAMLASADLVTCGYIRAYGMDASMLASLATRPERSERSERSEGLEPSVREEGCITTETTDDMCSSVRGFGEQRALFPDPMLASTPQRQRRQQDSWAARASMAWQERYPEATVPGGRIGAALRPLVRRVGEDRVLAAWSRYLAIEPAAYANPQTFATKFPAVEAGDYRPRPNGLKASTTASYSYDPSQNPNPPEEVLR